MKRIAPLLAPLLLAGCLQADAARSPAGSGGAAAAEADEYAPTDAERAQILAPLQSLFDALRSGDAALLRSVVDPSVVMHFSEVGGSGETSSGSSTLASLAERIASSDAPLIERMWDAEVRVHGPIATIWTPYDFYVGSELSHCGIDAATLIRRDGSWTIVGLSWTRLQPPACPLHPDGPPAG